MKANALVKKIFPSETKIQQSCIRWFSFQYPTLTKLLFAIPNGGNRNVLEAVKMKREGIVSGVSDLILLTGNGEYNSLCIEMKTTKGKLSENQMQWMKIAENHHNKYIICRSLDAFIGEVNEYLKKYNN